MPRLMWGYEGDCLSPTGVSRYMFVARIWYSNSRLREMSYECAIELISYLLLLFSQGEHTRTFSVAASAASVRDAVSSS